MNDVDRLIIEISDFALDVLSEAYKEAEPLTYDSRNCRIRYFVGQIAVAPDVRELTWTLKEQIRNLVSGFLAQMGPRKPQFLLLEARKRLYSRVACRNGICVRVERTAVDDVLGYEIEVLFVAPQTQKE